jgi:Holliday junction resolvasome RuvABC endonuclease subunit
MAKLSKEAKIAAFDLGTMTGFAVGHDHHGNVMSGWWSLKPGRYDGGGMRFIKFKQRLDELHAAYPFEIVAFEEVRKHRGTDAAHVYGGLLSVLQVWCEEKKIPYEGIPVGTIKKFCTGKGNADKAMVIEAVSMWGFKPENDNEADALALLCLKLYEIAGVSPH